MNNSKHRNPRESFLVFGKPAIGEDEISEVIDTLRSGWIGTGPKTHKFEQEFANYIGSKYAVALNSCTAGLHLALIGLGVGLGDEVITTPLTFCADANVIMHVGAKPVFVDVDLETMNIDPRKIEEKITNKTKAILVVHMAGRPCEMDLIMKIARKHKLKVIEDAAHSIESIYQGKKIGAIGDISCFSFYVTKNLVTSEGGMVVCNDKDLAEKIRVYGLHGMDKDAWSRFTAVGYKNYDVVYPGFKYNMTDIQASIGLVQLSKIELFLSIRESIWSKYDRAFEGLPFKLPSKNANGDRHARHLYQILIDEERAGISRDNFQKLLHNKNIGTGTHYTAIHLFSFYRETFGYVKEDFPNASYISDRTISLPISASMSDEDVEDVIYAVKNIIHNPKSLYEKI